MFFSSSSSSSERAIRLFSLLDPQTELEIISYRISQILFCARGPSNSPLACCWAFTTSRPSTSTNAAKSPIQQSPAEQELLYQCQVFRCDIQEAVRSTDRSIERISVDSSPLDLPNSIEFLQRISPNDQSTRRASEPSRLLSIGFPSNDVADRPSDSGDRRPTANANVDVEQLVAKSLEQRATPVGRAESFSNLFRHQRRNDRQQRQRLFHLGAAVIRHFSSRSQNRRFSSRSVEKNVFRLRKDVRKNVSVALQQIRGCPLNVERCVADLSCSSNSFVSVVSACCWLKDETFGRVICNCSIWNRWASPKTTVITSFAAIGIRPPAVSKN